MKIRNAIVRVICASRLADALNETDNILRIYARQLRSEPNNALALLLAQGSLEEPVAHRPSDLYNELLYLAPYLRYHVEQADLMALYSNALDQQLNILAKLNKAPDLTPSTLDGKNTLGFLADFAEACHRAHYQRSLAFAALAGLAHYTPDDNEHVSYPDYQEAVTQLINLIPEPGERGRARVFWDMLMNDAAMSPVE